MKKMTKDQFYNMYSEILMDDDIDEQIQKINNKKNKKNSIEKEFLIIKKNDIPEKSDSWFKKIISYIFK